MVSEVFVGVVGEISTLSGLSNLLGVGFGVLFTTRFDAPITQIEPSESIAADVAISLLVPPNLKLQSGAPALENVEMNPSLAPPRVPAIHVEVAASVVPITKILLLLNIFILF